MIHKIRRGTAAILVLALVTSLLCSCADTSRNGNDVTAIDDNTGIGTGTLTPDTGGNDTDPVTDPPAPEAVRISFLAAGDNIGHEAIFTDARNRANENSMEYNFLPMYNDIAPLIGNADISFINQETLMGGIELSGGKYYGYPYFNSPQDMGRTLVELGFDIVNIANNHMLDWKAKGLEKTLDFWDTQPVTLIGGYRDRADFENIRIYEEQGVRIALLSFTEHTNFISLDSGSSLFIPYINDNDLVELIKKAKGMADLVFVSMHWGDEDNFSPSSLQRRTAQLMADNGVDVVIGTHPHVLQEIKWVPREDGGKMLLIYSLGNLLSTMLNGWNMVGAMASFTIVKEEGMAPYIENPLIIPTVTHYSMNRDGLQVYLLENYSEELAMLHGCRKNDSTFTFARAVKYVTDTIDQDFLSDFFRTFN
ncbi:MAG: CapA family protein [Clostridia bacterium]|nr:CapA family protein [Clostridia bacterium]